MAQTGTQVSFEAADQHLHKTVRFVNLLFLSIGAIIGSGWLFASMKAADFAGPAAVVSWVIGGIFIIFVALTWAEPAAMLPRTGAIVRYPQLTHGAFTGWIMGWAYWLSAVSVPAIEAEAVVTYMGGRFPSAQLTYSSAVGPILQWPRGIGFGVGLMIIFSALNFFGVRLLSEVNRWFVWWKLVVPVVTFIFLFLLFKGSNFTLYGGFTPRGSAPIFQALSVTGIIFAYLGFRQALDYGGEARNPQRDIPLATVLSVVITMAIYTLLQIAFIGALNWHSAGIAPGAWAKLAESHWAGAPLYSALNSAGIASFGAMATVLLIDAGISPSGTGWIYTGTSLRTFYGLSIPRYFPGVFQLMNRWGIPWVSLVAAFVIGSIFFVPAPSWYLLVGFITSTTVITYLMGGVGLPVMRALAPQLHRPFRLPVAWFLAPIGFLAAIEIVYWSGFTVLNNAFAAIFIGLTLFAARYAWQRGWTKPHYAIPLAVIFLGAWVYINRMGGWTLSTTGQVKGSWPFPIYDIAFSADVVFFCVALWVISGAEGRRHVQNSAWVIFMILAMFPLSYWGEFGPLTPPALRFPWGTLIAVGIGIVVYIWGAMSGVVTDELQEILRANGQEVGTSPVELLPGLRGPRRLRTHPSS
jgi:amino acid transporter